MTPDRLRLLGAILLVAAGLTLAMPTVGWGWPALCCWAPLLVLARDLRTFKQRLLAGWLAGALYEGILFRWVAFTMEQMSGLPPWAAAGCLVAYALWHGLQAGVFLALAEPLRLRAARTHPGLGPLTVGATFAITQWVWPYLFPWSLGHALWQWGPGASIAALGGVPLMAAANVTVNALMAEAWLERTWRPLAPGAAALALVFGFGFGWSAHVESAPITRTLRVAVVQMNYSLEEKKGANPTMRARFLDRLDATLRALPPDRFDLVVASEGAYPLYWRVDADTWQPPPGGKTPFHVKATRRVQEALRAGPRTHAIIGGMRQTEEGRTRNGAVHFGPEGRILGHYDKNILVPFGEYLPGTTIFPSLAGSIPGISDFEPGDTPCHYEVAGEPVVCGICYESIFAGFTRETAGDSARLLVNLTIDVWFGTSTAPPFHLMVQSPRAAELGIPLVRSALTGISSVIGPNGVPLVMGGINTKEVLDVEVPLRDLSPPYRTLGPLPAWLMLAWIFWLSAALLRERRGAQAGEPPPA